LDLSQQLLSPEAGTAQKNFLVIYVTMGFERLPDDEARAVANLLLKNDNVLELSESHRTSILLMLLPMLHHLQFKTGELEMSAKSSAIVLEFLSNIMLLTPGAWKDRYSCRKK
jgi:hypothetical protein